MVADAGLNVTWSDADWPGLRVSGRVAAASEKPVPEIVAELTVRAAVPVERMVTLRVAGLPTFTLPKESDAGLIPICAVDAVNCTEKVWVTPAREAVRVTVCVVLTAEAVAVKDAVVAPDGTVTDVGTESALLLLASATASPPVPAALESETEHASVTEPVKELELQVMLLRVTEVVGAAPVPESATVVVVVAALLVRVSAPVTDPVAVGAKLTCMVEDWPGLRLSGNEAPEMEKPVPETVAELMVSVLVPLEVMVTVCVAVVPAVTLPNASDVGFTVIAGATAGLSCIETVWVALPAEAVSVTDCEVETAAAVAVKAALVAPAATVTEEGTVTALLLLERATDRPPLPAAAVSVTVQESVAAPVMELLAQVRLLRFPVFFDCPWPVR